METAFSPSYPLQVTTAPKPIIHEAPAATPSCSYGLVPSTNRTPVLLKVARRGVKSHRGTSIACKGTNDGDYSEAGRLVDETMIVLRLRIKELEMMERDDDDDDDESHINWMEWEKRYFEQYYNKDVYALVGLLQFLFMNTRPSFAMGMVALFALSVPISVGLSLSHAMEIAKVVIDRLCLSL